MARKPKQQEAEQPQIEILIPATNDVVNLARRFKTSKKQMSEIAGSLGEMVANAVEKKHLDRKAFSIVRALDSLSDERLAITLPHLMRYIDDLDLRKRATIQGDFYGSGSEGETNVSRLRSPRRTSESAGQELESVAV